MPTHITVNLSHIATKFNPFTASVFTKNRNTGSHIMCTVSIHNFTASSNDYLSSSNLKLNTDFAPPPCYFAFYKKITETKLHIFKEVAINIEWLYFCSELTHKIIIVKYEQVMLQRTYIAYFPLDVSTCIFRPSFNIESDVILKCIHFKKAYSIQVSVNSFLFRNKN